MDKYGNYNIYLNRLRKKLNVTELLKRNTKLYRSRRDMIRTQNRYLRESTLTGHSVDLKDLYGLTLSGT